MVAAGILKAQELYRFEASIYRNVLGIANMNSNKAILIKMTSIRLSGEVVIFLSKDVWQ
jgi:hypothetical protein